MQLCEELQLNLLSYLNANDLITFCYESKYFRKLLLKKFSKIFEISAGFCSVQDWAYVIQKNVFNLIQDIHNDLFFNERFILIILILKKTMKNYLKDSVTCLYFQFVCIF